MHTTQAIEHVNTDYTVKCPLCGVESKFRAVSLDNLQRKAKDLGWVETATGLLVCPCYLKLPRVPEPVESLDREYSESEKEFIEHGE
ncbi:MAG: hypothetical protein ACYTEQ_05305 [Planctomycetota bacterium]|jgi:hypothetical protein